MLNHIPILLAILGAPPASLELHLQMSTKVVQLGDPVYVRVMLINTGDEPVVAPCDLSDWQGRVGFELSRNRGRYVYRIHAYDRDSQLKPQPRLMPRQRAEGVAQLWLPVLTEMDLDFWKQGGEYSLRAFLPTDNGVVWSAERDLAITLREEAEDRLVRSLIWRPGEAPNESVRGRIPLGMFGLDDASSRAAEVENNPDRLSPGSLRNLFQSASVARAAHETVPGEDRAKKYSQLSQWLEKLDDGVEREFFATRIVEYCRNQYDERSNSLGIHLLPEVSDRWQCRDDRRLKWKKEFELKLEEIGRREK